MNAKIILTAIHSTLILLALTSCGNSEKPASKEETRSDLRKTPISFQNLIAPEFVPVIDGGGYVFELQGHAWYVHGDKAVMVKGLPERNPAMEVIPSVDGGAYAATIKDGLWRLDRDMATKVTEGTALPERTPGQPLTSRERALFVLWQYEMARYKAAQEESVNHQAGPN